MSRPMATGNALEGFEATGKGCWVAVSGEPVEPAETGAPELDRLAAGTGVADIGVIDMFAGC